MEQIKSNIQEKRDEMKRIWQDLKDKGSFKSFSSYEEWEKRNEK